MYPFRWPQSCLASLALLLASGPALAEPLRLEEAVIRSLARNPDLAAFAYELKAQHGRVEQAGTRPPIEVGVLMENVLGSGTRSATDAAEMTLSLGFVLERGALERRRDAALAGANVLDTELRIRQADVAAEAARRFISVLEYQQHLQERRRARELAQQTLDAVQLRVRAAKVPQAEAARAEGQLARARLEEEHAEHELLTARRRLVALWGETTAEFAEAQGELTTLPPLPTFAALQSKLIANPDFERFVSEKRLRESELRLAQSRRHQPWHVTAGVRRFEEDDDHAFVVGLTIPLASRSYARGAIAESHAQLSAVEAKEAAARVKLDAELYALYQELTHAYTEVSILRDDVLPKMEQAVAESRYAYERGRYGYIELAAAQRELLDVRHALSAAYAEVHRHRVEIERLTGASLTSNILR